MGLDNWQDTLSLHPSKRRPVARPRPINWSEGQAPDFTPYLIGQYRSRPATLLERVLWRIGRLRTVRV